jgi:hypothetical protein
MAVITSGNHPKLLWPGIKAIWGREYGEHPLECVEIFDGDTSTQSYEEDIHITGFGLAPVKAEGNSTTYDSETQGYTSRYTNVAYALGYIVTREEMDDNLYMKSSKTRVKALAFSMRQTKENVGANVLNRAFNPAYVGGDGVELCSTAHTDDVGGTWSNELATAADLSEASLEDLLIQISDAKNGKNLKISIQGSKLIIPTALQFEATRILNSSLRVGTADNDINAIRSKGLLPGGIAINHYLTDSDAWFIKTNCPDGMKVYNRVSAQFTQDNDFDTDNAKAKCYERYSFGWSDPRGLYGSPGA